MVAVLLSCLPIVAVLAGAALPVLLADEPTSYAELLGLLLWLPVSALVGMLVLAVLIWVVVRVAGLRGAAGRAPGPQRRRRWRSGRRCGCSTTRGPGCSRSTPRASRPTWLRLLGARIGKRRRGLDRADDPVLTQVNDQSFLADDTLIGGYELGGGWLRVERVKIGKRAFVGNSGMAAPGRRVPKASLVAVLSAAPRRKTAHAGESWLGSPPARCGVPPRTTTPAAPTTRRLGSRSARALVEACRIVPVAIGAGLAVMVAIVLAWLARPVVRRAARAAACGARCWPSPAWSRALVTVAAKWLLVGRLRPGAHPLWSSFVWRNELADTFVEVVAAPWFARAVAGTPLLNVWFRLMGAKIGRGVWCETYWLPETDLVELGDGATVNQGSVVQTHLFHDRMLSMDRVVLKRGSTLGPNSVILPSATLGRHATVGPVSLVMRGESVPDKTVWIGNPIGPWALEDPAR